MLYNDPERTRAFVREFVKRAREAAIEPVMNIASRYDPPAPAVTHSVGSVAEEIDTAAPSASATSLPISPSHGRTFRG